MIVRSFVTESSPDKGPGSWISEGMYGKMCSQKQQGEDITVTYFEKRMQEALNGHSAKVQKEYQRRIDTEKARRDSSKNGFVKTCAQQEIDRLEKELARIQEAVGNNYREEYTAEELAQIELTRLIYSKNAFVQISAAREIGRLLED